MDTEAQILHCTLIDALGTSKCALPAFVGCTFSLRATLLRLCACRRCMWNPVHTGMLCLGSGRQLTIMSADGQVASTLRLPGDTHDANVAWGAQGDTLLACNDTSEQLMLIFGRAANASAQVRHRVHELLETVLPATRKRPRP